MTDVRNARVLITGAASGLGRRLATRLGSQGARLILWDVDEQSLAATREELEGHGNSVAAYTCDLGDRAAIAHCARQVIADHGGVDVLVNNAGVVTGKTLLEASDEDIQRTFDVNALALFWTTRAFLPGMQERDQGHVVTIASAAGLVGTARLVDYSASKFAAVGFADALRLECRRLGQNIRSTVVCPYLIDTGMFDGAATRWRWILPVLRPDYVAGLIDRAIARDRARVITPRFVLVSYLGRLLPVSVFDWLMDRLGMTRSMDQLRGRGQGGR